MSKPRLVVITGGGSGMGQAIALRFASAGDKVYVLGRDMKKLEETAKKSTNIVPVLCDITDVELIEKAKNEILSQSKTIDVLVNCAGGNTKTEADISLDEANKAWSSIVNLNLTGTFNMIFALLPHIKKDGGRIINITSQAALMGSSQPGVSGQAYAASKAGIHGMTRTLANSISSDGITVNCVAPGVIDHTDFFGSDGLPEDRKAANLAKTPVGRLGEPKDVAAGVFYLASDEAGFITGEILNINGGVVFGR